MISSQNEFWKTGWKNNHIPFHQNEINADLIKFFPGLGAPSSGQVFVPLCGKSLDLLWLAQQGYSVLGVEISEIAVEAFFQENKLPFEKIREGKLTRYQSGPMAIFQGDFFDLTSKHLEKVKFIYDRAALVALPQEIREQYRRHLKNILPHHHQRPQVSILLIAYEMLEEELQKFPGADTIGPPYSFKKDEIEKNWGKDFSVKVLRQETGEFNKISIPFQEGLTRYTKKIYQLSPL